MVRLVSMFLALVFVAHPARAETPHFDTWTVADLRRADAGPVHLGSEPRDTEGVEKLNARTRSPDRDRVATLAAKKPVTEVDKTQLSTALRWMLESAEYHALALATFRQAGDRVAEIARERRWNSTPWVVVLDADETILGNWGFQIALDRQGASFSMTRFREWIKRREADAIPGAVGFAAHVLAVGGKIAVITNRPADLDAFTEQNLRKLGFSTDPRRVCILGRPKDVKVPPFGNNKDERRQALRDGNATACWDEDREAGARTSWEQPQDLVLHMGDNVQDFPGVTQRAAAAIPTSVSEHLGRDWFLMPNPVYGSWSK